MIRRIIGDNFWLRGREAGGLLEVGGWLLGVGYWLLAIGCWLLGVGDSLLCLIDWMM